MTNKKKNAGGAPAMYSDPKKMQTAIEKYFKNPPTKILRRNGEEQEIPFISITGLALHLGFCSRQSMYDYEERPQFSYIIKKARTLIESEYEFLLQNGNTTGAIFALKQFKWTDKVEQDNVQDINIVIDHAALGIKPNES
tara:strand:+ start:134 stop:553 length:420 start_codon:yes stop_codon:yes gene_type:complete